MKITVILMILTVVASIVTKIIAKTMSHEEEVKAYFRKEYPTRATVSAFIFALLAVSTIISLIVTIVTW